MSDRSLAIEEVRKLRDLRERDILTVTECAFRFLDVIGNAPQHMIEVFPILDAEVIAYVENEISRGEQDYYASRFSVLSNPGTPMINRVVVESGISRRILCYRQGSSKPFEVESQHPYRVAFETVQSFLAEQ